MRGFLRLEFKLPADIKKKGRVFVSQCPLLDVYSQGNSRSEALDNLREAVKLFIESCFQRGTLEQVLRDSGFEAAASVDSVPRRKQEYVNVPLSLIASKRHAEVRAH